MHFNLLVGLRKMEFWDLSLRISEKCLWGRYTLTLIFEISTWFVWEVSLANKLFGMEKRHLLMVTINFIPFQVFCVLLKLAWKYLILIIFITFFWKGKMKYFSNCNFYTCYKKFILFLDLLTLWSFWII